MIWEQFNTAFSTLLGMEYISHALLLYCLAQKYINHSIFLRPFKIYFSPWYKYNYSGFVGFIGSIWKTQKTFNVWVLLLLIRVESLFFITNSQAYPAPSLVFSAPSSSPLGVSVRFAPLISHSGVSVRFKVCATGRGFFYKGHENKSLSHLSSRQSWFHCYSHVSCF